jgi:hypothetical protein
VGSESTSIANEHDTHEMTSLGIGFLDHQEGAWELEPDLTNPIHISEPLVVLSLGSLFEDQSWPNRQEGMIGSLPLAPNASAHEISFEEVALLVLMEAFCGKFTPLSEVFECDNVLGSRRVYLNLADRFGFKATSRKDVLAFFNNPDGKIFLYSDTCMGPDLFCVVQDEETKTCGDVMPIFRPA